MPTICGNRRTRHLPIPFQCHLPHGHHGDCSPFTLTPADLILGPAAADTVEVLPHDVPGMTHDPAVCAAWAAAHNIPRAVACRDHWEPTADREAREALTARWRDRRPTRAEQAAAELPDTVWLRERAARL